MAFEFLKKSPKRKSKKGKSGFSYPYPSANKRGQGFNMYYKASSINDNHARLKMRMMIGTALAIVAGVAVLGMIGQHATPDFTMILAALMSLCGLVLYDVLSRRIWEKSVTEQIKRLSANHDRLVREVARNRNDIGVLKDGLSGAASAVEAQSHNLPPSSSAEARMLETIVEKLGGLGDAPRATPRKTHYNENVLELELMAPPKPMQQIAEEAGNRELDFEQMSDSVLIDVIRNAIRHDQLDIFVQPIVALPQRKPRMYEVFARIQGRPGQYIPAARYMELAAQEQLVSTIDNLLLLRCLQILKDRRNLRNDLPYILNISSATLNDTGFMGDLVSFLAEHRETARSLIFELPQAELENLDPKVTPVLDGLSQLGCQFSMDRVRSGRIDIGLLKSRHIRFIKMDATWLIREGHDRRGMSRIIRLKKQLDASGIDLIVEKVETETQVRELLDFAIDFGQGYLFGKPDMYAAYRDRRNRERAA